MKKETLLLLVLGLLALGGGAAVVSSGVADYIVKKISEAIAFAEGFYVPGSIPQRFNNPGDLTRDLTGKAVGQYGMYMVYGTPEDGWEALYKQVRLMFGGSRIYNPLMTIADVARSYTATEQTAWARNVAAHLGVSVNTKLSEIV
jgi:hypothetical protein